MNDLTIFHKRVLLPIWFKYFTHKNSIVVIIYFYILYTIFFQTPYPFHHRQWFLLRSK